MLTLTKCCALGLALSLIAPIAQAQVVKIKVNVGTISAQANGKMSNSSVTVGSYTDTRQSTRAAKTRIVGEGGVHAQIITEGRSASVVVGAVPQSSQQVDVDISYDRIEVTVGDSEETSRIILQPVDPE